MVHIQIYGHIPSFFILGRGLFQCPRRRMHPLLFSVHHADARGGAQGGGYRREYRDGEVDDFLPKFFLVHGSGIV